MPPKPYFAALRPIWTSPRHPPCEILAAPLMTLDVTTARLTSGLQTQNPPLQLVPYGNLMRVLLEIATPHKE